MEQSCDTNTFAARLFFLPISVILRFINVSGAIGLILDVNPGHGTNPLKTRYNLVGNAGVKTVGWSLESRGASGKMAWPAYSIRGMEKGANGS